MSEAKSGWDLSDLYKTEPAVVGANNGEPEWPEQLGRDLEAARRIADKFVAKYQKSKLSKLGSSGLGLAKAIARYEQIRELIMKANSYAELRRAADLSDGKVARLCGQSLEKGLSILSSLLFFPLAVGRLRSGLLSPRSELKHPPELEHYGPWLQKLQRESRFQLSLELEQMLQEKEICGRIAWSRHYDEVCDEMRVEVRGRKLTLDAATDMLAKPDGSLRKRAALGLYKTLKAQLRTLTLITNSLAKDKEVEDRFRGYKSAIAARNVENQIEDEIVDALIYTVVKNYPRISHRFYAFKAKTLHKKRLAFWDRNAPLLFGGGTEKRYTWDEARSLVHTAFNRFSPTLGKIVAQFFDQNWVDYQPRPGKASGAFAQPTVPSAHPYVLLNFRGKPKDVSTLAHEMGHSTHQFLAAQQGLLLSDTPLIFAETASVFGEGLLFRELLKLETDPAKRKALISAKADDGINTVCRQIAMCKWELRLHSERKEKGELSSARMGQIWLETQREALGPSVHLPDSSPYSVFWGCIPHFIHAPLYVYSYSFGQCLANALLSQHDTEGFETKYLAFLASGGSQRHPAFLRPFGIDLRDPDFWQRGIDPLARLIDQIL